MISVFRIIVFSMVWSLAIPAEAGPRKEIRDWYVWCDDELKCVMQTSNEEEIYGFGFERYPKANAEPVLFLSTSIMPAKGSQITVIIDGVSGKRFVLDTAAAQFENGVWEFPGQNQNNTILIAMMAGKSLVLKFDVEGGSRKLVTLSLSGVTGNALFMDEAQGRLGNRDALQAKGDGEPADAITRVTVLNSSKDMPVQVVSHWHSGAERCSEGRDDDHDLIADFGGIMVAVEDSTQLFVIPCGLPGAYNLLHTVLLFDTETKQVRTASLPIMGQRGPTLMDFAYNTDWDDTKSTLSAFYKGRGLGDCGSRSVWYWEGGYYSNFELVEEYVKGNCDGKYDDWPQIWPPQ